MSYTSARENVLADIETDLEAIDGSGDYYLTAATVSRNLTDISAISESDFPFAAVIVNDAPQTPLTAEGYETDLEVGILGAVHVKTDQDDEGLVEKRREKWFSDVALAMLADPRRGGYARDTRLVQVVVDEDPQIPVAMFLAIFRLKLDLTSDAP